MDSDSDNVLRKIYSQRGNVLILKDGFKFSKYGDLQTGETGWKCVEKSCRAKLYTINGEYCRFSRQTGQHKHLPLDENVILRQAISNRLKKKSTECLTEKPSKLVEKELKNSKDSEIIKLTMNDIKLIKDNMYHARAKKKQNLPKKKSKIEINSKFVREHENCQNNDRTMPAINLSKKSILTQPYKQENKYEDWTEWISIEPHFLAIDI